MMTENKPMEGLFTRWDVTPEHLCINITGKTAREVWDGIVSRLDPEGLELLESLEYDSVAEFTTYDPTSWGVIIYTVRGGSEGWYTHVEMVKSLKLEKLVLLKTLDYQPERMKRLEGMLWNIIQDGE